MSLTETFTAQGWAALGRLLTDDELVPLREEAARIVDWGAAQMGTDRQGYLRLVQQIPAAWRLSPRFDALTRHPAIQAPAREALGTGTLRLLRQHLVIKPADMAHELPWHQDLATWPTDDADRAVAVWVALDDVSEATGAVRYITGSHRGADGDPVAVPVVAGGGLLHHPLVWHASATNRTPAWRRACIHVFAHPDATPRGGGTFNGARHPLR